MWYGICIINVRNAKITAFRAKSKEGKMCKHKKLVYIGKQPENLRSNRFLYLFNCTTCKTTISMKPRKSHRVA